MKSLAFTIALSGFVLLAVSLPLVYRRVPMNWFYGFRIPAAFQSQQSWYEINAYSGRLLARWSLGIIVSGLVGQE
jgi:hypothetical protein